LVCVRVRVGTGRRGDVILDPGYHIARPIVVMEDMQYPHTGWFTCSTNPRVTKEYCYEMLAEGNQFIGWQVRETRDGVLDEWLSLIYVSRPFAKCLTITEKRSL